MLETHLSTAIADVLPNNVDFCSIRLVETRSESLQVRQGVVEPVSSGLDVGAMVTLWHEGGLGYAATSDISPNGLSTAVETAKRWATATRGIGVLDEPPPAGNSGSYQTPIELSWDTTSLSDRLDMLRSAEEQLRIDDRIVDSFASLDRVDVDSRIVSTGGGLIEQHFARVHPDLTAVANEGSNTQTRSFGGGSFCGQGGREVLDRYGFEDAAPRVATQALELLSAPNAPTGVMDVVLAPDQMILQIHESIGHPLELDRILGDERNYAGTSFVTLDMFGEYQYGSDLLNVTFDPTVPGQMATCAFDDDGTPATREHLIRDGILERPLGGSISQARAGAAGVANSRSCNWNRPPIDRMGNLNVEPGSSTVEELIEAIEDGVYLETNNSWSIDDSRNKFQFGCEYGRRIENGELTHVVRNPSYRGISATFWRNLTGVGNAESFTVMGTPNCGKGEPNQVIGVGHASPACRFSNIEVFGGEQ